MGKKNNNFTDQKLLNLLVRESGALANCP